MLREFCMAFVTVTVADGTVMRIVTSYVTKAPRHFLFDASATTKVQADISGRLAYRTLLAKLGSRFFVANKWR